MNKLWEAFCAGRIPIAKTTKGADLIPYRENPDGLADFLDRVSGEAAQKNEAKEPVAWSIDFGNGWQVTNRKDTADRARNDGAVVEPLYK